MTQGQTLCFFVSDLHGSIHRYQTLFHAIAQRRPHVVFLGGDLLPSGMHAFTQHGSPDFIRQVIRPGLARLRDTMGASYPRVVAILGNDDPRSEEEAVLQVEAEGLWHYAHQRSLTVGTFQVFGYAYVPPTPFLLKDWERYDVSRYVDPGCVPPEEGIRSVQVNDWEIQHATIAQDLEVLTQGHDMERAVFLFHSPPYRSGLDRAALDGKLVDHVPLDVHVGSIAIARFIQERQPWMTLHGHVHESTWLTGVWHQVVGRTHMFTAAHHGPELALVSFSLENPSTATRELL